MNNFKNIFIHGYTASSKADWYPAIIPLLNNSNVDFIVPDLPGDDHPQAINWLDTLHKAISDIKKPLVLVGHSLGTRIALLYLEKYQPKIERVFLIAAFANRLENAKRNDGDAYPDFFTHEVDLEKIKPLVGKFVVIHSKDDDSIPYKQGVELANELSAELITYENCGHFYKPENATIIFEVLQRDLNFE